MKIFSDSEASLFTKEKKKFILKWDKLLLFYGFIYALQQTPVHPFPLQASDTQGQ